MRMNTRLNKIPEKINIHGLELGHRLVGYKW